MFHGYAHGALEVRARKGGGATVRGRLPYGPKSKATLSDGGRRGGRPRKEYFKSHAFKHSVEVSDLEIHFLSGHDFGKALASRNSGSLILTDTAETLIFEARLSAEVLTTSHGADFLAMLASGLVGGISPGFRIPTPSAVEEPERVFEEDPSEGRALIREISEATLYELSAVTRPAYDQTEIEARNWALTHESVIVANCTTAKNRWRL
ncbi:MAG: HK97 family phage prohead protease [Halioglobus sp.]|nr:HK97 family phage prohead protease [Halioglobus sp.]